MGLLKKIDQGIENLSIGLGYGLQNQLEGMYQMARHPIQSGKGLLSAGKAVVQDPKMVAGLLANEYRRGSSGLLGLGEVVGENISPRAFVKAPARRDMLGGPKARTADLAKLDEAKRLLALGVDKSDVWRKTGWWVDTPDGIPRFEIPDDAVSVDASRFRQSTASPADFETKRLTDRPSKVMPHKGLFDAYPQIDSDYSVQAAGYGPRFSSQAGSVDPSFRNIKATAPTKDGLTNALLHEFQHPIQIEEGMALGGHPGATFGRISETLKRKLDDANDSLLQRGASPDDLLDIETLSLVDDPAEHIFKTYQDIARKLRLSDSDADSIISPLLNDAYSGSVTPHQEYLRLAGEAEARAVQARQKMTAAQRKTTPPWESYDVPLNSLLLTK